jgi:opacity protein-like surface antigen
MMLFTPVVLTMFAVALGVAPSVASAQDEAEIPAFYLGGAFAIGLEQFDLDGKFASHDEGFGFDVWAGYRSNQFLAYEVEFAYLAGFNSTTAGNKVDFTIFNFTANVKGYPPVPEVLDDYRPYVVVGIGGGRFEAKSGPAKGHDKGGVFRFGGGVEMNFGTPVDLILGADYLVTSGLGGGDYLQIKLGFQRDF